MTDAAEHQATRSPTTRLLGSGQDSKARNGMGSALQPLLFTPPDGTPLMNIKKNECSFWFKIVQLTQLRAIKMSQFSCLFRASASSAAANCTPPPPLVACRCRHRRCCSRRRRRRRRRRRPTCTYCCAILSSSRMASKSSRLQCGFNCPAALASPQGPITPLECRFGHCKRACTIFLLFRIRFDSMF